MTFQRKSLKKLVVTVGVKEDFHFEKVEVKFEDRILSKAKASNDNRWDNDDLTVDR